MVRSRRASEAPWRAIALQSSRQAISVALIVEAAGSSLLFRINVFGNTLLEIIVILEGGGALDLTRLKRRA